MDEELFLKQRLVLDDRHVKLLEKKFRSFLQNLPNESTESAQVLLENLLISLLNYQTSLERHPPIQMANDKEINDYNKTVEETAIVQSQTALDIVTLKEELIEAQKGRDQKLEYDRVAREIMQFETRDTYTESIEEYERDINLLETEIANKSKSYEERKSNLYALLNTLKNLQRSVEEERNTLSEDQIRLQNMERGYVSSDDEGDIGLSDNEEEKEEEKEPVHTTFSRFQERNDEEDEEEGIVVDTPMVE